MTAPPYRPALTHTIARWSMYLLALLGALLAASLAINTWHAWQAYHRVEQLAETNLRADKLFHAADALADERALTRVQVASLGSGQPMPRAGAAYLRARQALDQGFTVALAAVAADPELAPQLEQMRQIYRMFGYARQRVDAYAAQAQTSWDEGTLQGYTLMASDLLDKLEQSMQHETQALSATDNQRTGRLVEITVSAWRIRKYTGILASTLQVQSARGHVMPQMEAQRFEAARVSLQLGLEQLLENAQAVHDTALNRTAFALEYQVTELMRQVNGQIAMLEQGQALDAPDTFTTRVRRIVDSSKQLQQHARILLRQEFQRQLIEYRNLLHLSLVFIVLGTTLTGAALLLLRSRVIKPLVRLQLILDVASDAIITLDDRLDIRMINKGAERLFDTRIEQVLRQPIDTLLALEPGQREALLQLTRQPGEYRGDAQTCHDAKWVHVSLTASPIQVGDCTGVLLIIRDVHARKVVEESLSRSLKLIRTISRLQDRIFTQGQRNEVYRELLLVLLEYTSSRYGFIGLVREPVVGRAVAVIDEMVGGTAAADQRHPADEPEARMLELDRLVEQAVMLREPAIFNGGAELALLEDTLLLERGALDNFMLLPVVMKGLLIAVIGIGQRTAGYTRRQAAELAPLSNAYASMVAYFHEQDAKQYSEEHLRAVSREQAAIFSTSPVGLMIVQDFRIERANTAAEEIFAAPSGGMIGWRIGELLAHENDTSLLIALMERSGHDGRDGLELQCIRAGCIPFWARLHARALDAQHPERGFVLACIDMTEQKHNEAMLRGAKEDADAASHAKSAFLATMSHEIRTPMNGVIGMLELLSLSRLDDEQRDTLDTAQHSAGSLLRLIDEILDFSKIEAGRLEIVPEVASLTEIVQKVLLLHSENASRKGLKLSTAIDPAVQPTVIVDEFRLEQILNNFVSNAIKFTLAGGVGITLRLEAREESEQTVAICVSDTGIGMTAESIQRLFEPFTQAESDTTRRFGGTGLGLAICKHLAERMDGKIDMQSAPGIGTMATLTLTLPLATEDALETERAQRAQPAAALAAPLHPGRPILFAEDNPINRKLIAKQLELLGVPVDSAEDGAEALEKWRHGAYSLLLTDCHMPKLDGYQLAHAIREAEQNGKLARLPIIACTANASRDEVELCLACGMDDFLSKPLTLDKLRQMMSKWLAPATESAPAARPPGDSEAPPAPAGAENLAVPLERAQLRMYSDGDPQVELDILRNYWSTNHEDVSALRQAFAAGDLPALFNWAHRIKGASLMVGAEPLGLIAQELEQAARNGAGAEAAAMRRFDAEFDRLTAYLTEQGVLPLPA